MAGLENLPKDKWIDSGKQPILKTDFVDIETAILEIAGKGSPVPTVLYNDTTSVRVPADTDIPVGVSMSGFPNVFHPGLFVDGGLTDGKYRENDGDAVMDFDTSITFWGNEKASQWYAVYAVAGDADTAFTLKAMPWLKVSSQATQTITLRNNLDSANIGYGWGTDTLVGYMAYFISGASKGMLREVSANNNDDSTGGTITYTGSALTVAQGDWFILLPSDTNFRWLGDFYNESGGDIRKFYKSGVRVDYDTYASYTEAGSYPGTYTHDGMNLFPPLARWTALNVAFNDGATDYAGSAYPNISGTYQVAFPTGQAAATPAPVLPIIEGKFKVVKLNYTQTVCCNWYCYPDGVC